MWQSTAREDWELLRALGDRQWFRRLWTVQEYCLSLDANFICGKHKLHVSKGFPTLQRFFEDMTEDPGTMGILLLPPHIQAYREVFEGTRVELMSGTKISLAAWQILASGRSQTASNPRDSIYGLQGLLQKHGVDLPDPDYSKTVELVYTNATRAIIKYDKALNVLLETDDDRQYLKLPSWVPTWNSSPHHGRPYSDLHTHNFHSSGPSANIFEFPIRKTELVVRGIVIDHTSAGRHAHSPLTKSCSRVTMGKSFFIGSSNHLYRIYPSRLLKIGISMVKPWRMYCIIFYHTL